MRPLQPLAYLYFITHFNFSKMSHRRSAPSPAKGKGSHLQQQVPTVRPPGQVKPVFSSRRHGKPVEREVSNGCAGVLVGIIIAALYFLIF